MRTFDLPGPAYKQFTHSTSYAPVDCDFTDELEYLSTKRFDVEVFHFDDSGHSHHSRGQIVDIRAEDKADYAILSSNEEIRLDRIKLIRSGHQSSYQLKEN